MAQDVPLTEGLGVGDWTGVDGIDIDLTSEQELFATNFAKAGTLIELNSTNVSVIDA